MVQTTLERPLALDIQPVASDATAVGQYVGRHLPQDFVPIEVDELPSDREVSDYKPRHGEPDVQPEKKSRWNKLGNALLSLASKASLQPHMQHVDIAYSEASPTYSPEERRRQTRRNVAATLAIASIAAGTVAQAKTAFLGTAPTALSTAQQKAHLRADYISNGYDQTYGQRTLAQSRYESRFLQPASTDAIPTYEGGSGLYGFVRTYAKKLMGKSAVSAYVGDICAADTKSYVHDPTSKDAGAFILQTKRTYYDTSAIAYQVYDYGEKTPTFDNTPDAHIAADPLGPDYFDVVPGFKGGINKDTLQDEPTIVAPAGLPTLVFKMTETGIVPTPATEKYMSEQLGCAPGEAPVTSLEDSNQ